MTDWSRVAAAVEQTRVTYDDLLNARADDGRKKSVVRKAEDAWHAALKERANALREQWTEEDGFAATEEQHPSLGNVLKRYYQDRYAAASTKTRKRKR